MPDFALELGIDGIVCGIDEVGRGPLAGPVVAAAVILDRRRCREGCATGIDDSKKLTREAREEFAASCCGAARSSDRAPPASPRSTASTSCRRRFSPCAARVRRPRRSAPAAWPLVDGNRDAGLPCPAHTVVGGDGLVALHRRRLDHRQGDARPPDARAWRSAIPAMAGSTNVGYGTAEHRAAICASGAHAAPPLVVSAQSRPLRVRREESS